MAPNKTLYVKDGDMAVWEEVDALVPGEVSALVAKLLRQWLADQKGKAEPEGPFSRLVVSVRKDARDDSSPVVRKAFNGRWLVSDFETDAASYDAGTQWDVAVTEQGRLVVCIHQRQEDVCDYFAVYDTIDDAEADHAPADLLSAVAAEIGEDFVEELDI